jgi:hypothetical protein
MQLAAFPNFCSVLKFSGIRANANRLQLRGQPWIGYHIPSSLSLSREAIKGAVHSRDDALSMAIRCEDVLLRSS